MARRIFATALMVCMGALGVLDLALIPGDRIVKGILAAAVAGGVLVIIVFVWLPEKDEDDRVSPEA